MSVDVTSHEFKAAVAAAVAAATGAVLTVEQTSLELFAPGPDHVTVEFSAWTQFAGTAYQSGQQAGFDRHHTGLRDLIAKGGAFIAHDPRKPPPGAAS